MNFLEVLLKKKAKILKILLKISKKINFFLKNLDVKKIEHYNLRREKILNELERINLELEKQILIEKKLKPEIENLIIKVNGLLDRLIDSDNENINLMDKIIVHNKGNYIENYKKFNK